MTRCKQEMCPNWSGDGNVCPCAIFDLDPPSPEPWEMPAADVECCASGRCEVCAPGGFGGSRYWSARQ